LDQRRYRIFYQLSRFLGVEGDNQQADDQHNEIKNRICHENVSQKINHFRETLHHLVMPEHVQQHHDIGELRFITVIEFIYDLNGDQ